MTGSSTSINVRFGDAVMDAGYTVVPNLVLLHYHAVGMSTGELVFTLQVWRYWWTDRDPYPALSTIARAMGMSRRGVRKYVASLRDKGLLNVTERTDGNGRQTSSEYDFEPLIRAVVAVSRTEQSADPDTVDDAQGIGTIVPTPSEQTVRVPGNRSSERKKTIETRLMEGILEGYLQDFAREFNDQAPLRSSVTRARRLWEQAEVDQETMIGSLYLARAKTKQYIGNIKAGEAGQRRAMPYFFAVLEDILSGGSGGNGSSDRDSR